MANENGIIVSHITDEVGSAMKDDNKKRRWLARLLDRLVIWLPCWLVGHRWAWAINRKRGCDKCGDRQKLKYFLDEDRWIADGKWKAR